MGPISAQQFVEALRRQGRKAFLEKDGVYWQDSERVALERHPLFCLDLPSPREVRSLLWRSRSLVATYVMPADMCALGELVALSLRESRLLPGEPGVAGGATPGERSAPSITSSSTRPRSAARGAAVLRYAGTRGAIRRHSPTVPEIRLVADRQSGLPICGGLVRRSARGLPLDAHDRRLGCRRGLRRKRPPSLLPEQWAAPFRPGSLSDPGPLSRGELRPELDSGSQPHGHPRLFQEESRVRGPAGASRIPVSSASQAVGQPADLLDCAVVFESFALTIGPCARRSACWPPVSANRYGSTRRR